MNKFGKDSQSGKSVMELLIVVAIVAVIFTFAVSQFGRSGDNLGRQNIAREFKVALERARFDSVKRRPTTIANQARVTVIDSTSFSVTTDMNQNGQISDADETRLVDLAPRGDVTITGTGLVFPITIRFDHQGHITVQDGSTPPASINPLFYFCNGTCTVATANSTNSNIVYVSPTGTVAMMLGGETIPTFANPTVTAVASNDYVNPLLSIWTMVTGSPSPSPSPSATPVITPSPTASPVGTPSPSPSPTASPVGTPDPSPSPTASPSPTVSPSPTATPTPAACTYGQRPTGSPPCTCVSPMWVRNNGKCQ